MTGRQDWSWARLDTEIRSAVSRSGLPADRVTVVRWTPAEEAKATARDYAYVYPDALGFHFSTRALDLDEEHRQALIAHEVGHCLAQVHWGSSTEEDADAAAQQWLGVPICYDKSWPGKGLQVSCSMSQPNPSDCGSDRLHKALYRHFEHNQKLPPSALEELRSLLRSRSCRYVVAPKQKYVFRGVSFDRLPRGMRADDRSWQEIPLAIVAGSSWTETEELARRYHVWGAEYHVVHRALVDDNPGVFLRSTGGGLYSMVDVPRQEVDREILAIDSGRTQGSKVEHADQRFRNPHPVNPSRLHALAARLARGG